MKCYIIFYGKFKISCPLDYIYEWHINELQWISGFCLFLQQTCQ